MPNICVVGACNVDLTSYASRMPKPGETIKGEYFEISYGGKGANQAIMAAKLGSNVSMVAKVGNDHFGTDIKNLLTDLTIDTSQITQTEKSTGTAQILVDGSGNNSITVVTGANDNLTSEDIEIAAHKITEAKILLVQCEIPIETTLSAMKLARANNTMIIFNPAPVGLNIPEEAFSLSDIICLNESETEALTGIRLTSKNEVRKAAHLLRMKFDVQVIITLGEKGAYFAHKNDSQFIQTDSVKALDTTGAGDCFIGSLAYFLSIGFTIKRSMGFANTIASTSVQKRGTHSSYPSKKEVERLLNLENSK